MDGKVIATQTGTKLSTNGFEVLLKRFMMVNFLK
jgi:hypothetical protein